MNDFKNTKTADLIAEWARWDETRVWQYVTSQDEFPETMDALASIAAELDRRAAEAGIRIENGRTRMDVSSNCGEWRDAAMENASVLFYLSAAELHALLGWLLLKEGGGNA
jgi:hypothetical protein